MQEAPTQSGSRLTTLLAILVVTCLALGLGAWLYGRNQKLLGEQLSDLAAAAPADAQFFLATDLRKGHRLSELVTLARDGAKKYPDALGKQLAELEKNVPPGLTLEQMADWVSPAACMSWFPLAGQKSLLSRQRVDPPFELAIVVALREPEKVREHLGPWFEKHGAKKSELEGLTTWEQSNAVALIYRDALVLTSSQDGARRTLAALQHKAPRLLDEPHYREAVERVEHGQGGMVYWAPDRVLLPLAEMFPGKRQVDEQSISAFASLQSMIGTLTPQADNLSLQGFVGIDPQSQSAWAKTLLTTPGASAELARFIPAGWGNYHAVNLPYVYRALWETALVFPQYRMQVAPLPMWCKFSLGYSPDEMLGALSGEVGVAFDAAHQSGVLVVGIKDRDRLDKILAKLEPYTGKLEPRETVEGTRLLGWGRRPNLRVHFADGAMVITASPDQTGLIKTLLAVAAHQQPSLLEDPLMKSALDAAGTNWVALNYISLARVGGTVMEALEANLSHLDPAMKGLATDFMAELKKRLPTLESSGVVLVDKQGLRLRTFGNGLISQTYTIGLMGLFMSAASR